MTTHDQNIEATPSPEKVGPATARTEHRTEHAASSAVAAEPSTAQTESTVSAGEPSAVATDAVTNQTPPPAAHSEPSTPLSESAIADTEAPAGMTETRTAQTESTTERSLFADDELAGLRARWDNVQAGFVDDPKESQRMRPQSGRPGVGCGRPAHDWIRRNAFAARGTVGSRRRGVHRRPSSRPEALPRFLRAAARGVRPGPT